MEALLGEGPVNRVLERDDRYRESRVDLVDRAPEGGGERRG